MVVVFFCYANALILLFCVIVKLWLIWMCVFERRFLDGFSNLRCKMYDWDFEFLNLKSIWSSNLKHLNYILASIIIYSYWNTRQVWTLPRDTRLLVWWQLVSFITRSKKNSLLLFCNNLSSKIFSLTREQGLMFKQQSCCLWPVSRIVLLVQSCKKIEFVKSCTVNEKIILTEW